MTNTFINHKKNVYVLETHFYNKIHEGDNKNEKNLIFDQLHKHMLVFCSINHVYILT